MFVGRKANGSLDGLWAVRQWEGQEQLADDHPEVVAFLAAMSHMQANVVTAAQLLRQLDEDGDLAAVDAAVASAGGLTKRLWERAALFDCADPLVVAIGQAIGKTPEQIDDLFARAKLQP